MADVLIAANICEVEGCSSHILAKMLCSRHYHRLRAHGDVKAYHPKAAARREAEALATLSWVGKIEEAASRQPVSCLSCDETFYRRSKGAADRRKCCSRECGFNWLRTSRAAKRKPPSFVIFKAKCRTCGTRFKGTTTSNVYCSDGCKPPAYIHAEPQHKCCMDCGTLVVGTAAKMRCSPCSKERAKTLSKASGGKAANRSARKIKQRGVTVESVNPLVVLDRDKWTCQLCGVPTPKRLRGSYEDKAPEVDHIIPLSSGGEHSYKNVQCACRKCNIKKAGVPRGQMRLFG